MTSARFSFRIHSERLAIARLDREHDVPAWARGGFVTISRTADELSVVCAQAHVPREIRQERDRIALGIEGTIPMTTIGLLTSLCGALAAVKVPVFVISTYDTDWLLVTAEHFDAARTALTSLGHTVDGALPTH